MKKRDDLDFNEFEKILKAEGWKGDFKKAYDKLEQENTMRKRAEVALRKSK